MMRSVEKNEMTRRTNIETEIIMTESTRRAMIPIRIRVKSWTRTRTVAIQIIIQEIETGRELEIDLKAGRRIKEGLEVG